MFFFGAIYFKLLSFTRSAPDIAQHKFDCRFTRAGAGTMTAYAICAD